VIARGALGEVAEVNAGVTTGVGVLKSACVGVERLDGLGGVGCLEHRHRELIVVAIGGEADLVEGGGLAVEGDDGGEIHGVVSSMTISARRAERTPGIWQRRVSSRS